jgi:hypothetical protein
MKYKIWGNPHMVKWVQEFLKGKPIDVKELSAIPEQYQELILEPEFYYGIWDRRVRLIASFFCDDHSVIQIHYSQLPPHVFEDALTDIERQGGTIEREGYYQITVPIVKEFLESGDYQEWLKREAKKRGIKIIEKEVESCCTY